MAVKDDQAVWCVCLWITSGSGCCNSCANYFMHTTAHLLHINSCKKKEVYSRDGKWKKKCFSMLLCVLGGKSCRWRGGHWRWEKTWRKMADMLRKLGIRDTNRSLQQPPLKFISTPQLGEGFEEGRGVQTLMWLKYKAAYVYRYIFLRMPPSSPHIYQSNDLYIGLHV